MGTNFYIKGYSPDEKITSDWHIGKRSAAGIFCFDCGISLGFGGNKYVHEELPEYLKYRLRDKLDSFGGGVYMECPLCGKQYVKEEFTGSSAGIELGFNKNIKEKRNGVRTASSFTFAMGICKLRKRLEEIGANPDEKCIVNEYGDDYTLGEFLDILDTIPPALKFTQELNSEFS